MTIGITGGSGFIGSHVARFITERDKEMSVVVSGTRKYNLLSQSNAVAFVKKVDLIVHAAAINRGTDAEIISGNIVTTYNLAQALIKTANKAPVVYLSSIQATNESVYGKSKRFSEILLEELNKKNLNPVRVLRVTNVFGEGARPKYNSVVATFCVQAANSIPFSINDPKSEMNLLYVGELVPKIVKEFNRDSRKGFNIRTLLSENKITVGELAGLLQGFKTGSKTLKSKFQKDLYRTYKYYEENHRETRG